MFIITEHIKVVEVPQNHTILIGMPVKIECKFSGTPTPIISWYQTKSDGKRVPVTNGVYPIPGGSQLQIVTALPNNAGLYVCAANNGVETVEKSAYLLLEG